MAQPGTQLFTYLNVGKETVHGTPVAPTRQLYGDVAGVLKFDYGLNRHDQENAGVRTRVRRVTQMKEDVALRFRTLSGTSYDDLIVPFSQLKGGQTGAGGGADKLWGFSPSMTALNNPESYSIDVGDDIQNWRVQWGMWSKFSLSAALNDVTQLEGTLFGQRAVKGAKAAPAINSAIKIPGELWTIKFAASIAALTGASIQQQFLVDWKLDVDTGLTWEHYMDGNLFGANSPETDIAAVLTMTVESTALAVSEFYDKAASNPPTLDFIRLRATGPTLGATNYQASIDLPVFYREPEPQQSNRDGINLWKVTADLAYDPTTTASIAPSLTNSLAALP